MTDLLEQSAAWLEDQRHRFMTRPVTYQRGDQTVLVMATVGRTVFEIASGDSGIIRSESRDYLIRTMDLVLDGQPAMPRRGDRIVEVISGIECTHEVSAPGNEPEWRYSDPFRGSLRIHTRLIGQGANP